MQNTSDLEDWINQFFGQPFSFNTAPHVPFSLPADPESEFEIEDIAKQIFERINEGESHPMFSARNIFPPQRDLLMDMIRGKAPKARLGVGMLGPSYSRVFRPELASLIEKWSSHPLSSSVFSPEHPAVTRGCVVFPQGRADGIAAMLLAIQQDPFAYKVLSGKVYSDGEHLLPEAADENAIPAFDYSTSAHQHLEQHGVDMSDKTDTRADNYYIRKWVADTQRRSKRIQTNRSSYDIKCEIERYFESDDIRISNYDVKIFLCMNGYKLRADNDYRSCDVYVNLVPLD